MPQEFEPTTPIFVGNATFLEELYERYLTDPGSVDQSWRDLFKSVTNAAASPASRHASWSQISSKVIGAKEEAPLSTGKDKKAVKAAPAASPDVEAFAHDSIRAIMMIRAYRVRGHLMANLDPLGIEIGAHHPELDPATYGFT